MAPTLRLPRADGTLASYTLSGRLAITPPTGPITSRIGMAAVHVVADPLAAIIPTLEVALDWDATLSYRHYVWSLGLAVAEAMDTSQRGMGFDWPTARELIRRSVAEARTVRGAVLASGAGTDQLAPGASVTLADVEAAYEEQCSFIEGVGGRIILMASRALAACARGPEDYEKVYARILAQVSEPVILHWLGDMFDPALAGYWGSLDLDRATETLLGIVHEYAARIDGVKISLLDQRREIAMRARFPKGVRMYTGDDFDYPTTLGGARERAARVDGPRRAVARSGSGRRADAPSSRPGRRRLAFTSLAVRGSRGGSRPTIRSLRRCRMPADRSYVAQNTAQRDRLSEFVERASDKELEAPMPAGWTVAAVLAHLAFWDQRIVVLVDAWQRAGATQAPSTVADHDVDWINDAGKPMLLALSPRAAARLAVAAAEAADARVAGLKDEFLTANAAAGGPLNPLP